MCVCVHFFPVICLGHGPGLGLVKKAITGGAHVGAACLRFNSERLIRHGSGPATWVPPQVVGNAIHTYIYYTISQSVFLNTTSGREPSTICLICCE